MTRAQARYRSRSQASFCAGRTRPHAAPARAVRRAGSAKRSAKAVMNGAKAQGQGLVGARRHGSAVRQARERGAGPIKLGFARAHGAQ
eukprot:504814-Prymnesium_polylepis.2